MEDKLSQGEYLEQEKGGIDSIQQQTQDVICRIFFVRHGKTTKEENESQDIEETLSEDGKEEIRKAGKILLDIGCNPEDTLILYSGGKEGKMQRIIDSIAILQEKEIGFKNFRQDIRLDTTEKIDGKTIDNQTYERARKAYEIMSLTNKDILDALKTNDKKFSDYKNIVLLGHRANSAFKQNAKQMLEEINIGKNTIHTGEILESDVGENFDIVPYHNQKDVLWLRNDNQENILTLLQKEEGIKDYIQLFVDHKINIFELQNIINVHFKGHPEIYEKYLASDNEDLRVFCLANLLKNKEYKKISKFYIEKKDIFFNKEKELLIKNHNIPEIKVLIIQSFIDKRNLRKKEESELFKKYGGDELYDELEKKYKIAEKIIEVQGKSLDVKIKKQQKGAILQRKIFKIEEEKNNKEKIIYLQNEIELNIIIQGLQNNKKYILPAHVGNGKSIWISDIAKRINYTHTIFFVEGIKIQNKEKRIEIEEQIKKNSNMILCIDAIDEIPHYHRNEIKKNINLLSCGVLMTSRLSEYNDKKNTGFETLEFDMIDKKSFLEYRIPEKKKRDVVINFLKTSNIIQEIESNPLLLNFICILTNDFDTLKNIEIKPIEKMINTDDLYENIVKLILYKHQSIKGKNDYEGDNTELVEVIKQNMDILGEFAYFLFQKHEDIAKDFEFFKKVNNITNSKLNQLNILFKKTENGQYGFIHQSFREFFFLKYIEKNMFLMENEEYQEYIFDIACDFGNIDIIKEIQKRSENNIKTNKPYFISGKGFDIENKIYEDHLFLPKHIKNTKLIKFLVKNYIHNINEVNLGPQKSLFNYACKQNNIELVDFLIDSGVSILEPKEDYIESQFEFACGFGGIEIIKLIFKKLEKEIKISDIKEGFKNACNYGNLEVIIYLFDKYEDQNLYECFFNVCDNIRGNKKIIDFFIKKGININERDNRGKNGFMYACENGNIEIVEYLLDEGININEKDNRGMNGFMYACEKGTVEIVEYLLGEGININEKDNNGKNGFMYACEKGTVEIVEYLLGEGININEKDNNGKNGFMYACEKGTVEIVEYLLGEGININEKDNRGMNGFMYACEKGTVEIVEYLLDEGIDINEKDNRGMNAFILACIYSDINMIRFLLDKGININEKDNYGRNGFMYACCFSTLDIVKYLLDEGININERDNNGRNGLMLACEKGGDQIVKYLLDKGVDINERDNNGKNAFIYACEKGHLTIVNLLLNKGIDVNLSELKKTKLIIQEELYKKIYDFQRIEYNKIIKILQIKIGKLSLIYLFSNIFRKISIKK